MKNYENELPTGYEMAYHIDARDKKTGLILNLIALGIAAVILALGCIPLFISEEISFKLEFPKLIILYGIFFISIILYMVLHELTHGAAYKLLTGKKLTFGISWSCAFCGVPNIFVYRRASIIALAAPLTVFSVVLGALCAVTYFIHPLYYVFSLLLLGIHIGGCSGDGYLMLLFLFKFKDNNTLVKDTGPEQFIYTVKD